MRTAENTSLVLPLTWIDWDKLKELSAEELEQQQ
jgi:hypothetical protein